MKKSIPRYPEHNFEIVKCEIVISQAIIIDDLLAELIDSNETTNLITFSQLC